MSNVTNFLKSNLGTIGAGASGLALGGTVGYLAGSRKRRKKKTRRTRRSKFKRSRKAYRRSKKRKVHHYKSHKRIHITKSGQPYVILASGKARFISKKSARISRKRRGGRY